MLYRLVVTSNCRICHDTCCFHNSHKGGWKNWFDLAGIDPAGKAALQAGNPDAVKDYLLALDAEVRDGGKRHFEANGDSYFVWYEAKRAPAPAAPHALGEQRRLSPWIDIEHCSTRVYEGTDPAEVANRVAFIEKTPRVRVSTFADACEDWRGWCEGPKGCGEECGQYQPSRAWCDAQLRLLGYVLPE